jgi:Flp pilus assembly protein TadG
MMRARSPLRCSRAAAAAEMALVTPLLLIIIMGSVEVGNYFYNEHILTKAVRDGARYAARQSYSYYGTSASCASPSDATMIANVKTLIMTSLLSGGTNRLALWNASTITVSASCQAAAGGQNMTGIYTGRTAGAPVVTVNASVPYVPIIGAALGMSWTGLNLNASQQAAVSGI